ncbi:MAG: hypothetical protein QNJ68_17410 [Microcoleaceae cyanobacterium MO_207.B10]|nr:hypothetical protein [Microcoleaceae cyanobacterium MO_207.B10]
MGVGQSRYENKNLTISNICYSIVSAITKKYKSYPNLPTPNYAMAVTNYW